MCFDLLHHLRYKENIKTRWNPKLNLFGWTLYIQLSTPTPQQVIFGYVLNILFKELTRTKTLVPINQILVTEKSHMYQIFLWEGTNFLEVGSPEKGIFVP